MGIFPVLEEISFWFLDTFLRCLYKNSKCLHISCMSVCPLEGLHTYWNQAWMRYFLKISGNIPGRFLHHFPIITNCLYVCQSVSWLTSLLKLGKYRDMSCPGWYIFLNFFWEIPRMFVHNFPIITNFLYVFRSFCWLTSLLKLGK